MRRVEQFAGGDRPGDGMDDMPVGSAEVTGHVSAVSLQITVFVGHLETSDLLIGGHKMVLKIRRDFGV